MDEMDWVDKMDGMDRFDDQAETWGAEKEDSITEETRRRCRYGGHADGHGKRNSNRQGAKNAKKRKYKRKKKDFYVISLRLSGSA